MEQEFIEKVKSIKEMVGPTSLYIGRIPKEIKTRIKELAKEEFMEDYGFLFKKLLEVYEGFYPKGDEEVKAKLDILADRLALVEEKLMKFEKEPQVERKSFAGNRIGGKKDGIGTNKSNQSS